MDRDGARRRRSAAQRSPPLCGASSSPSMRAGSIGTTGRRAWFLPGKFRFCPACGDQPAGAGPRDQQGGEPVGRGPQLGDDPAGVERAALDEHEPARHCRRIGASCSLHRQSPGRGASGRSFQRLPVRRSPSRSDARSCAGSGTAGKDLQVDGLFSLKRLVLFRWMRGSRCPRTTSQTAAIALILSPPPCPHQQTAPNTPDAPRAADPHRSARAWRAAAPRRGPPARPRPWCRRSR